jgi:hypothetical protein
MGASAPCWKKSLQQRREVKKSPFSSFSAPSKGLLPLPLPPASDKSKFTGDYKSAPKQSLLSSQINWQLFKLIAEPWVSFTNVQTSGFQAIHVL